MLYLIEFENFSLTPALSRWERGNRPSSLAKFERSNDSHAQPKVPPLPAGGGWGEGGPGELHKSTCTDLCNDS